MAVLSLSDTFKVSHKTSLERLHTQEEYDDFVHNDPSFFHLINAVKKILSQDQYVIIKGLINDSEMFFQSFIKEFGVYYGAVERTGIKLECNYTGCNRKALGLHNDDAIDIDNQPKLGFIQVTKEDPLLEVVNGIVIIKELVGKLKLENPALLEELLCTPVPMLSYGINYISGERNEIITSQPILYIKDNVYQVRFDDSRTAHFYYKKQKTQSTKELNMIENFIKIAHEIKHEYHLECGDILMHNNLTTLHDRSECSLQIDEAGNIHSREIMVSFAR